MGVIERPLNLRLLAAVERDLQGDVFAPEREVPGQKDPRRSPLAQKRQELKFLERLARLRELAAARSVAPAAWLIIR